MFSMLLIFSENNNRTSRKQIHDIIKKNKIGNVLSENKMGSLTILFILAVRSTVIMSVKASQSVMVGLSVLSRVIQISQ